MITQEEIQVTLGMAMTFRHNTRSGSVREKADKLECVRIKNVCSPKDNRRVRRQATDWEKTFAKETSDKGLSSKTQKELLRHSNKNTNNLV